MIRSRHVLLRRSSAAALALGLALGSTAAMAQDAPTPDAADAAAGVPGDDIVITGSRLSQRLALSDKRLADNAVEALQANDVGKLPDQNVAEALKRLPGLSVANDQGEGRYVIIRGIDPNLVNVVLNGQTLPAPEPGGRVVKLDDLPSAMIQSVIVTKSLLPYQDANAVGGEVNVRTKNAFDSKDPFFLDLRGAAGYYKLNGKTPWEVDGTVGGRFGPDQQFGAVVSVNYSRRPIESQNFQGSTAYNALGQPDSVGLRDYNLVRTRLGIVGNFDWHPSDSAKIYIRSSYSKFTDNETRDQNVIDSFTYTGASSGTYRARGSVLVRHREEDDNTKSVTLGGDFNLGGGLLQMSGGWTKAVKVDPLRSEFRFRTGNNTVTGTFDLTDTPAPFYSNFYASDLTRYTLNQLNIETRQAQETIWQGRFDYSHPIGIGDDSSIQFGAKYLDRHKTNNQDRTNYGSASSFQIGSVAYTGNIDFYDGDYAFGPRIDYWAARAYLDAHAGISAVNTATSISATLASDFDVSEKIVAAYIMATVHIGPLTIVPGVRMEHTSDDTRAKIYNSTSTLTQGFNSFGSKDYTNWFPGINAKLELAPNVIARMALTTAIGRPNYADLAPYVTDGGGSPVALALGNPDLKPYEATDFDMSLEFYPNKDSIFSLGFFHKAIDNPIYPAQYRVTNVTYAGVTYASANVTQSINADHSSTTGFEVNAQTQFTFLPGFLSGFGLSANYAHITGHATAANVRAGGLPLAYQSRDIGNVQVFYEKYGLAARVAFNYRSSYLDGISASAATDQYSDGNGQLDVHVSYQVTPMVTVFGDGTNLTDAPWRRFMGASHDYLIERERYGMSVRGGVQLHF